MLIRKTTKYLGDPCVSTSRAYKINDVAEKILWACGATQLARWIWKQYSLRRYGSFVCGCRCGGAGDRMFPPPDHWRKTGADLECSYCGSWAPKQFRRFCREVVANPDPHVRVELADGCHKVYASRPGVRNARDGAIKFYLAHAPGQLHDANKIDALFLEDLNAALRRSRAKFAEIMESRRP